MKLIDKLPKSIDQVNYKSYVRIMNTIPDEKPEGSDLATWSALVHLTTLSILLNVSPAVIENLPAAEVYELISAIGYLDQEIKESKCKYKVLSINELSYDKFTTYQALRLDQWNNLGAIIKMLTVDLTDEQIDSLSIYDAMQIFFLSRRKTVKYLTRLKYSLMIKAIGQTITNCRFWNWIKNWPTTRLKNNGVG